MSFDALLLDSDVYNYDYFTQDDVCRLCWCKNAAQGISLKSDNSSKGENNFIDLIKACLDIILTQDSLPNRVCTTCYEEITKFHNFKTFCQETDRKLRDIQNSVNKKHADEGIPDPVVKLEKNEMFTEIDSRDESFDDFLESIQQSTLSPIKQKKVKLKKYIPKRSPTYCNICRVDLKVKDQFSNHNSKFHGIEENGTYKCFGCEKYFKNRKTRLGHEINFCKGLKDGYRCTICDRCLPKRRMYEAHMKDHRDNVTIELPEDLFKCKSCGVSFKTRDSLKEHVVVHATEKKNFVCESCGRVFTRQDYLHKHKLTHTGTKQHVCAHCGFRATQRSSLTVHIRKHTGERPYSCDMCPQRCISSSNLRAHRRRHSGLKKYECTICEKKFGYALSLSEHVECVHKREARHACSVCGAAYSRQRALRRHLRAAHEKIAAD